jgi:hypothetical protein
MSLLAEGELKGLTRVMMRQLLEKLSLFSSRKSTVKPYSTASEYIQNGVILQKPLNIERKERKNWIDVHENASNRRRISECHKHHDESVLFSVSEEQIWRSCSLRKRRKLSEQIWIDF